jgi:hypothetical protein
VDDQAALKTLNSTDITKMSCKDVKVSLNKLGQMNEVCLEWVKAHKGIISYKAADKLAKAGGWSTSVIGKGLLAKSAIKQELKESMLAEWTTTWKSVTKGRQTKVFWPEPDLKKSEQLMTIGSTQVGKNGMFWLRFCIPEKTICHHRTE